MALVMHGTRTVPLCDPMDHCRIGPGTIAAVTPNRRPVRHGRWWCRFIEAGEIAGAVNHAATDNGQLRDRVGDLVLGAGEVVAIRHDQIGELASLDPALLAILAREPGDVLGPHPQRCLAIEAIALRVNPEAADGLAGDEPGQRNPRVIGGDARRVRTRRNPNAVLDDTGDWRRGFGGSGPIALDEIFALVGHPMLHRDSAAECSNPLDRAARYGLRMVEEPVEALQRNVAIDLFIDIERARDRLVVGRVEPPRPAVLRQDADDRLELAL